jgi:hypothetical protein
LEGFGREERSSMLLFTIIYEGRKERLGETKNFFRKTFSRSSGKKVWGVWPG